MTILSVAIKTAAPTTAVPTLKTRCGSPMMSQVLIQKPGII